MNDIDALGNQFRDPALPREDNDIMVVGVGGGGGNAVNHMFRQGVEKVTFVVCNTDKVAVEESPVPNKVIIGDGRGAGNVPERGKQYAEEDIEKIENIFNGPARMVFITAGMGGGTGTGAGPVVARVAKEKGLLTIGIVTIPFLFEGRKKILKALDGADEMAKYVDALLIINNERLAEIYSDLDFFNAFSKADDTLSTAATSISEIITKKGYINTDFEDVDTTLRNGGTAIISTGYGEGEHRVTKAIEDALNSPLLRNRDIQGSKRLLINMYLAENSDKTMKMNEIDELRQFTDLIDNEVDVIYGATIDNTLGETVKITILAAGFDITIRDEEDEIVKRSNNPGPKVVTNPVAGTKAPDNRIEEEYGQDAAMMGKNYIILKPGQMDDDNVIDILERTPAYNRDKRTIDELKAGTTDTPSTDSPEPPSTSGNVISF